MTRLAKSYVGGIVAAGTIALIAGLLSWQPITPWKFAVFLLASLFGSRWKIIVPGLTGSMSVSFCFVLVGILELSLPETLIAALAAVLVQLLWRRTKQLRLLHVAFNLASVSLTVASSYWLYRSPLLSPDYVEWPVRLGFEAIWYFLANTVPIALAIALTENKSIPRVWRDTYFWSLPYYIGGAALAGIFHYSIHYVGWQSSLLIFPLAYMMYRSYHLYLTRLNSEKEYAQQLASLHLRTIQALALAIEAKDQTTGEHLQRVQVYALAVGEELGLTAAELDALRAAALLHDIGKLAVPEHIISKPGKLTPEEFDKMKIHPVVGAEILEQVQFPYPVVPIVRSHHERWNGTGYPDGLKGEQIPIGARILSAVDCLDALASDRQYRRALPVEQAMDVIQQESGTSFDPQIVGILQRRYRELEAKARIAGSDAAKLSTDVRVERGEAPAAGFESAGQVVTTRPVSHSEFVSTIGAVRQEVQALFELSQDLGNHLSLDETLSLAATRIRRVVPYDTLAVYLTSSDTLTPAFVVGDEFRLYSSLHIPLGQGLSGWVAENHRPVINGNPSVEPGYLNDHTKFSKLRAALAVPLEGPNGLVGVLSLYHSERDAFTKDNLRVLQAISGKLAVAIENSRRFQTADPPSMTDSLTGLPNARALFIQLESEIETCSREKAPLSILVADVDQLKTVNQRAGQLAGDQLLRAAAAILRSNLREQDYLARIGGDEFALVLPGVAPAAAASLAERLRNALEQASTSIGASNPVTLSIGQAQWPHDGIESERLLEAAEQRLGECKRQGDVRAGQVTTVSGPDLPSPSRMIH